MPPKMPYRYGSKSSERIMPAGFAYIKVVRLIILMTTQFMASLLILVVALARASSVLFCLTSICLAEN